MSRPRALIVFRTVEGQSARIATAIATELYNRGLDADIWDARVAPAPGAYTTTRWRVSRSACSRSA